MRIDILTKEYPPTIYGGAGVHVTELVRALRQRGDLDVRVHAFGEPRDEDGTTGHRDLAELSGANAALTTLGVDLTLAAACEGADLVHSHTWYANFGGHLASLMGGIPHVLTAHSLEPMRPWKAEQLGGGYRVSSWVERTAYEAADAVVAVSAGMREDILRSYPSVDPDKVKVVHNGIDSQLWQREPDEDIVRRHGVDPDRPSVIFVGRMTRQKGLPYLLRAAAELPPEVQLVLLAGAPDTPEIQAEVEQLIEGLRRHATASCGCRRCCPATRSSPCSAARPSSSARRSTSPSASSTSRRWPASCRSSPRRPAASPRWSSTARPGGSSPSTRCRTAPAPPSIPDRFVADLAAALTDAVSDDARAERMGLAGRRRAVESFSWNSIGDQTNEVYLDVLRRRNQSS